jgi:AcrR family transcriptional regulator
MKRTVVRLIPFLSTHPYDALVDGPTELPLIESQRAERSDAARNRSAILCAAERMLRECGPDAITMDGLACEAGVGKGTLFRRFGDRAGLFHALLDETERRLQEGFIRGPAPLGPGVPPAERLIAFGHALLSLTDERGELLLAAQPVDSELRYRSSVYGAHRAHVVALLGEFELDDAEYLGEVMLAAISPGLVLHQLRSGRSLEQLEESWRQLVRRLVD